MDDLPPDSSGHSEHDLEHFAETTPPEHRLSPLYRELLRGVGEDPAREGLLGTPQRAAKAFEFLTQGYDQSLDTLLNGAIFKTSNRDMVIVRDIEFYSLCEHHLLPFFGKVHVAYLPDGKVIGLSKIPRIVDVFARRLQIQENFTDQIARAIESATGAKGVSVVVEARHLCMQMRGIEKQGSSTVTSATLGDFRWNESARNQFLRFLPQV